MADYAVGVVNGWRPGPADVDDGVAVRLGIADPDLAIAGMVVSRGNSDLGPELLAAQHDSAEQEFTFPILPGAATALTSPQATWYDGRPMNDVCINEGVRFLHDQIQSSQGLTIIASGPLTDVGCLLLNYPDDAERIGRIIVLMGQLPGEQLEISGVQLSDFNFAQDMRAAEIVFGSTVPLTAMMFSVSSKYLLDLNRLRVSAPSAVTESFAAASQPWDTHWRRIFKQAGFPPWDAHTTAWLRDDSLYKCGDMGYAVLDAPASNTKQRRLLTLGPDIGTGQRRVTGCYAFRDAAAEDSFGEMITDAYRGS